MTDTPKFPDNPNHANGTCEDCGQPCQVYGCRWCPACYDAGSARVREASRARRAPLSATEWAATFEPLAAPIAPIEAPAPWQAAVLAALSQAPAPAPVFGLPLVAERGLPAGAVFLLAARPGRTLELSNALRLVLDDAVAGDD